MEAKSRRRRKHRKSLKTKFSHEQKMGAHKEEKLPAASNTSTEASASSSHSSETENINRPFENLPSKHSSLKKSYGKSFNVKESGVAGKCVMRSHSVGVSDCLCVKSSSAVKCCSCLCEGRNSTATTHSAAGISLLNEHKFPKNLCKSSSKKGRNRVGNLSVEKQAALHNFGDRTNKCNSSKSNKASKRKQLCKSSVESENPSDIKGNITKSSVTCETPTKSVQCLSTSSLKSSELECSQNSLDPGTAEIELNNHGDNEAGRADVSAGTAGLDGSVAAKAEETGRQLHSCPQPWRSGLKTAPVQLCVGGSSGQLHHRQMLALLNRVTDTKLELLMQRAAEMLLQPRPCETQSAVCEGRDVTAAEAALHCSSCTAAALAPPQLLMRRRDLISMLLHKAQDEELYTENYCQFLQGVSLALELHDDSVVDDLAGLREEIRHLKETCSSSLSTLSHCSVSQEAGNVSAECARKAKSVDTKRSMSSESLSIDQDSRNASFEESVSCKSTPEECASLPQTPKGTNVMLPSSDARSTLSQTILEAEETQHLIKGTNLTQSNSITRLTLPQASCEAGEASNSDARLAWLQASLVAEEARHLLRGAPSFRELLQEECGRQFHELLGALRALYTRAVAWCPRTDVLLRRNIKCHVRLLVLLHYAQMLPLQTLQSVRDSVAAPLQAAFTAESLQHGQPQLEVQHDQAPHAVLLAVELLCAYLHVAGPCNLHTPGRTEALCQLLQLVLPQLPARLGFMVRDVLDARDARWGAPSRRALRAG